MSAINTNWYIPQLNDICNKLNADISLSCFDNTHHDTFGIEQEFGEKSPSGEDSCESKLLINLKWANSETEFESKPSDEFFCDQVQPNLAKLIDMPIQDQSNKGLTGLNFKIIKVVHKTTQRERTKYVCTYNNCGKICDNKWSFLDHHRCHTGEKPYLCKVWKKEICSKRQPSATSHDS